jgi:hypothetical protein
MELDENFPNISVKDEVLMIWDAKLKEKGVKKPGGARLEALCCLYINIGKPIRIDVIHKYLEEAGFTLLNGSDSVQVRHLAKQCGFNIYKGGEVYKGAKIPRKEKGRTDRGILD